MSEPDKLISGFHSRGALPHVKHEGGTYFVTFREAGSLPKEVLLRFKQERDVILNQALAANRPLTWNEQRELFNWYCERVDRYLDSGSGPCHLRDANLADIVAGALRCFDKQRYQLHSWVVMPNHVHVVVRPEGDFSLSSILHSWKSFTSHEINRLLPNKIVPYWQSESFDHLIRDDDEHYRCCCYTTMNPVNARLCSRPEDWIWSSARVSRQGPGGETPPEPAGGDACAT